jgi:hypothetical protein
LKKLLLISLALVAIAAVAGATPVSCGVVMAPNSSTILLTSACTVNPDPGFYISSLTLTGFDSFAGGAGLPIVDFTGTLSDSGGVFTIPTFCPVSSDASSNSINCNFTVQPSSTVTGLNLSTDTVSITTASNTEVQGSVSVASINLFLDYAETQIPVTGTPEPATLGLMGSALVGLGLLARKKK